LPDKVVDDPPRLRDSARQLLALDFDILLVGDGVCRSFNPLRIGCANWWIVFLGEFSSGSVRVDKSTAKFL
jgi:hypothetical protein